jgi:hypothetical protein
MASTISRANKKCRNAIKSWRRSLIPAHTREQNAKTTISFIDHLEESRTLNHLELSLRKIVISTLHRTIRAKLAHWRQRGKIRAAIDGDENSKYFHVCASNRFRKNKISVLSLQGNDYTNHDQKMEILTQFFKELLGSCPTTSWNFDLQHLYPDQITQLRHLDDPFSHQEIFDAFHQMNKDASPGPDGFGPGFYRAFWPTVKLKILQLFSAFYNHQTDTECINRAHIVLLPKTATACTPDAFRPISLQNCHLKAVAKVLTNRLKKFIPLLIHGD